jgi:hypothetical protein
MNFLDDPEELMPEERLREIAAILATGYLRLTRRRPERVADLCEKYREVFDEEIRSRHKGFLQKRITWRPQANEEGGSASASRSSARDIRQEPRVVSGTKRRARAGGHSPISGPRGPPLDRWPNADSQAADSSIVAVTRISERTSDSLALRVDLPATTSEKSGKTLSRRKRYQTGPASGKRFLPLARGQLHPHLAVTHCSAVGSPPPMGRDLGNPG